MLQRSRMTHCAQSHRPRTYILIGQPSTLLLPLGQTSTWDPAPIQRCTGTISESRRWPRELAVIAGGLHVIASAEQGRLCVTICSSRYYVVNRAGVKQKKDNSTVLLFVLFGRFRSSDGTRRFGHTRVENTTVEIEERDAVMKEMRKLDVCVTLKSLVD